MISILLAVYNGEKYIKESIDSVLNQTFGDFELLIGLNNCSDNTLSIVESYNDARIRIFLYDEKGKAKTLNKLIDECKYDWIAIQDSDDIWLNKKLETQLKYINEYDIIGTFCKYIDKDGYIIGEPHISTNHKDIERLSFSGINQIINMSAIFKKSDLCKWDETIGVEDYELWLKLMYNGYKSINISDYLVYHRIHSDSNFNTKDYSSDISAILKKYKN